MDTLLFQLIGSNSKRMTRLGFDPRTLSVLRIRDNQLHHPALLCFSERCVDPGSEMWVCGVVHLRERGGVEWGGAWQGSGAELG